VIVDDLPRCLPQDRVDQIRTSAIFLTISVMDCLVVIIKCVEQNGFSFPFTSNTLLAVLKIFAATEIDKATGRVNDEAKRYTTIITTVVHSLTFKREKENENDRLVKLKKKKEKEKDRILEWIAPRDVKYITPKREKQVGDTCHWLLRSLNYSDWVGQGPTTMICSGKGTAFLGKLF
jgi:hypothetical protein